MEKDFKSYRVMVAMASWLATVFMLTLIVGVVRIFWLIIQSF